MILILRKKHVGERMLWLRAETLGRDTDDAYGPVDRSLDSSKVKRHLAIQCDGNRQFSMYFSQANKRIWNILWKTVSMSCFFTWQQADNPHDTLCA